MADAIRVRDECDFVIAAADAAVASGEIRQLPNGMAGVYTGLNAARSEEHTSELQSRG